MKNIKYQTSETINKDLLKYGCIKDISFILTISICDL